MQSQPPKLLDQVRVALRLNHYSYKTEQTYVQWIRRYILFHNKRHPKDMGVTESAVLFLYREIFQQPLENVQALRAKPSR